MDELKWSRYQTIRSEIAKSFARIERRASDAESAIAKLTPNEPGYARRAAQMSFEAALDRAQADGFARAMTLIFTSIDAAYTEKSK